MSVAAPPGRLVARETELTAVDRLLAGDGCAALLLEGDPGVGKTSVWEHGVALASSAGLRVLQARASGAEAGLPFAGLVDLLDGVTGDELADLPPPQRRALEVALYRADPAGPLQPHAIALGLLSALRALAEGDRLLLAVDDVQWLDRESAEALAYAARRLDGDRVVLLLTRRTGPPAPLDEALGPGRAERLRVQPASRDATRRILAERLGLRLSQRLLERVYATTLGNPLFTLEVGRRLLVTDLHALGEDVPLPDDVEGLLGTRVTDLGPPVRRALLAVALDADLRAGDVDGLTGALPDAVRQGVLVLDGERVRPSHPLLAAAAKERAAAEEREELHRALAHVVGDEHRRALHLALATATEDEELAVRVGAAAEVAAARGTTALAAELSTHALRLTPAASPAYVPHLLRLGEHLSLAGEKERLTRLLADRVEALPAGAPRAQGHLLLTNGVVTDNGDIRSLLDRALVEAGEDGPLRAQVLARLAINQGVIEVERLDEAGRWAEEALAAAGDDGEAQRVSLDALAWTRALRGMPIEEVRERYRAVGRERHFLALSPDRVAGQQHVWRGEVAEAREVLHALQALAEERAEPSSCALVRLHLCELALRTGEWDESGRLLDEWARTTDSDLLHWPMYERCRALLAAGRGDPDAARRWGEEAARRAEETGVRWDLLEARRALGTAALLTKEVHVAVRELAAVEAHAERHGVTDPGAFPVGPDLVEALTEAGEVDRAERVAGRLAAAAPAGRHPWAEVGARRCAALVALAVEGYAEEPAGALEEAAAAYAGLGLAFEHARTLLALGRARRRARKWGAARDTLERAAAAFAATGSPGWAEDARSELARVGARRAVPSGQLTATESRVVSLAAEGLSNRLIARELVVTVNTVEFHLRNAYQKLGVRSRAQLAGRIPRDGPQTPG